MENCFISVISSSGHGGAIYIDNTTLSLICKDTTFYECMTSNGQGGAIYFTNGLNIQIYRICALYCRATPHFQFAYFQTNNI